MTDRDTLSSGLFVAIAAVVALGALTAPAAAAGEDAEIGVTVEGDADGATVGVSANGQNESVTVPPADSPAPEPGVPSPEPPESPELPTPEAPTGSTGESVGVTVEGNSSGATVGYESPARDGSVSVPPAESPAPEPGIPAPAAAHADESGTVGVTVEGDTDGVNASYESPVRDGSVSVPPNADTPSPGLPGLPGLPEPPAQPEPPAVPGLPDLPPSLLPLPV